MISWIIFSLKNLLVKLLLTMNKQWMLQYASLVVQQPIKNHLTCDHNDCEEIVYFLLSCFLQTVWFLLHNLEYFDQSELFG